MKWKLVGNTEEADAMPVSISQRWWDLLIDQPNRGQGKRQERLSSFPLEDSDITLEEPNLKIIRINKENAFTYDSPLQAVPLDEQYLVTPSEIVSIKTLKNETWEAKSYRKTKGVFNENQTINKSQKKVKEETLIEVKYKTVNENQTTVN